MDEPVISKVSVDEANFEDTRYHGTDALAGLQNLLVRMDTSRPSLINLSSRWIPSGTSLPNRSIVRYQRTKRFMLTGLKPPLDPACYPSNSMSLYKRQYPKQVEYFTPPPAGKHVGEVEEVANEDDEMDIE